MRFPFRSLFGVSVALVAALAAGVAPAQTVPGGERAGAGRPQALAAQVPEAVIEGVLQGSPEGMARARGWITGGGGERDVSRRAVALIQALRERAGAVDGERLRAAGGRVYDMAAQALKQVRIARVAVQQGYTPPAGAIALDFGPPDARVAPGFEPVAPNDPRIAGSDVRGLNRPGDCAMCASGLIGVERIRIPVPRSAQGYRVILLTDNIGEPDLAVAPPGNEVVINGVRHEIPDESPENWLRQAYLGRNLSLDAQSPGRYVVAEAPAPAGLYASNTVGGVVFEVGDAGDALTIDLRPARGRSGRRTYVVGLIVEPLDAPPSLALTPGAEQAVASLQAPLEAEAAIAMAMAELIEAVATAAGPQSRLDGLPEPVTESPLVVSPS